MKTKPLLTIACSLLFVSCGDDETPSTPAAARENTLPTLDPECYGQALKYEISEGKKSMEEYYSAAENGKFGDYLAASDAREAQSRGWRTFRSAPSGEIVAPGEFHCPASAEQGKRRTCELCGACNGANGNPNRASVLIWAHGSPATLGS